MCGVGCVRCGVVWCVRCGCEVWVWYAGCGVGVVCVVWCGVGVRYARGVHDMCVV